jgi:hypothetical protein
VGDACIQIYSTEPGGGALTTSWDFATRKIRTFEIFCNDGTCLYSVIDPGFLAGTEPAPEGYHELADDTEVSFETIVHDAGVQFRLNNDALGPGESERIGTTPGLHNHPAWQLRIPEGQEGEFRIDFRFTTDSPLYADSQTFSAIITNLPPPATPTPTPTPTFAIPACVGDCDADGEVTLGELVSGVGGALGRAACAAFDVDADAAISIVELLLAVRASMNECPPAPTPTPTLPATLAVIQASIFSPRCALPLCHDSASRAGNLVLEPASSHADLVGIEPDVDTAEEAGLLRVDAGNPDNSFLLIKIEGPPPDQGGRMPLVGRFLNADEVDVIRAWIADGARP